ncbi:MAG TPA: hypothetical protein VEX43_02475, partial [Chthoniobacterales bacterium]|nr:hypothetical protein [Chthoniobacterales bacterium]
NVETFPAQPGGPFPEQDNPRYSASSGLWAACFSGGGPRSFAASLGQMRGLNAVGVLPFFGAISCVSGGSWFGVPFSFAPDSFSVDELLGEVTAPGDITVGGLQSIPDTCLGSALLNLTDFALDKKVAYYLYEYAAGYLPFDKIWARILNDLLLTPFALNDTSTYFSLDSDTVNQIVANNPGLAQTNFYTLRDNQPYVFACGTQVYPSAATSPRGDLVRSLHPARSKAARGAVGLSGQFFRHFEYSPGYVGTPQLFSGAGCGGADIGGGFLQSFGFDSPSPASPPQQNVAQVTTPAFPFLLSDAIGSSSAAIAAYLDQYGLDAVFPEFSYWPMVDIGQEETCTYSFGDGGILENTGIVSLLRRQYKVIFAFVNSPYPVGSAEDGCHKGVDGQITRLFGFNPPNDFVNSQDTQIFPSAQFDMVRSGLIQSKAAGGVVFAAGAFTIQTPNSFELAPYPGSGEVLIFWMYNDLNKSWANQLPGDVRALLGSTAPWDYMKNFPNYDTVGQNDFELLLLSAQQINLLADMWSYNIISGFTGTDQAFGVSLERPVRS